MQPRCHAALSVHPVAAAATGEVVGDIFEAMGPGADLAVVLASGSHADSIEAIVTTVQSTLGPEVVLWATAPAVTAAGRGIDDGPALVVWLARTGGARPMVLGHTGTDPSLDPLAITGLDALPEEGTLVMVGPANAPVQTLLDHLARQRPRLTVAGGLLPPRFASGLAGVIPADPGGEPIARGVVLPSGVADVVVSQGCRAVGELMVVTRGRGPLVEELAGRPALDRVDEVVGSLGADDRQLAARHGLHLGWVVDERALDPGPGDVLMRTVVGAAKGTRAMVVNEALPVGALVQFHLRDPDMAAEQLHTMLAPHHGAGGLLFTCTGRGAAMFQSADHDPGVVSEHLGAAVAGLFCAGELGPVGGRSWLHSFTATTVVLHP
jgi:small ligand-binding sensory domain FIST